MSEQCPKCGAEVRSRPDIGAAWLQCAKCEYLWTEAEIKVAGLERQLSAAVKEIELWRMRTGCKTPNEANIAFATALKYMENELRPILQEYNHRDDNGLGIPFEQWLRQTCMMAEDRAAGAENKYRDLVEALGMTAHQDAGDIIKEAQSQTHEALQLAAAVKERDEMRKVNEAMLRAMQQARGELSSNYIGVGEAAKASQMANASGTLDVSIAAALADRQPAPPEGSGR